MANQNNFFYILINNVFELLRLKTVLVGTIIFTTSIVFGTLAANCLSVVAGKDRSNDQNSLFFLQNVNLCLLFGVFHSLN